MWFEIHLPARWVQEGPGYKYSKMHRVYTGYFEKNNIEWQYTSENFQSGRDYLTYSVNVDSFEDVLLIKLKMDYD